MFFILTLAFFPCAREIVNFISEGKCNIVYLILSIALYVSIVLHTKEPRAIDVYKGKITLEITYKNSTPVDSVVVWKK